MADSRVAKKSAAPEPNGPTPKRGAGAGAAAPAATPPAPAGTTPPPAFTRPPPATAAPPSAPPGATAPPEAAPPRPKKSNPALQTLIEISAIIVFLAIAVVPLARFGIIQLSVEAVHGILVGGAVALTGAVLLFGPANYQLKKRKLDEQILRKYRSDLILTSLSVGATMVIAIMTFLEGAALLAFMGVIDRESEASIAVGSNYVLFASFTLLYLTMLLIVRTSFETRAPMKRWHAGVAYGLLAAAGVISAVTLLVTFGILNRGAFAQIEPRQAIYLFTLAVLLQIIAFKLLLRYPAISQIVVKELEAARRANHELRDQIQRRAYRAYFFGLGFVVLSMFLLGGVATRRLSVGSDRNITFILILYLTLGLVVLGIMTTRYLQHKYIAARKARQEAGDVIAKKRVNKQDLNRRILFSFSVFAAFLCVIAAILAFTSALPGLESKYGTDFMIAAMLVGVGPYGFYRGRQMKRIRAMDDKFPDFLRDLAESERAGMTLPRALLSASKGVYGALTPEIRHMSAQVEWGVSFTDALKRFSLRVRTPLIERTVALVVEAANAGGNVIDILTAAADDSREIKQIIEERRRQMGIYGMIVYIAFFVFLVVIFVLSKQFLPAFNEAAIAGERSGASGAGGVKAFDMQAFVNVFFHSALIQGIGGGLVSGVMSEGHPLGGLKHAVIMVIVSWIVFRLFVDNLLGTLLGG